MKRVSNEVLLERMNTIQKDISEIKNQFVILNGQVRKNTVFRGQAKVVLGILSAVGGIALTLIMTTIFGGKV